MAYLDENGVEVLASELKQKADEMYLPQVLNLLYPIGSIYMSVNSTNPETLFGGTWEAIEDVFLLGAGATYIAETTGGSATHTHETKDHVLTVDEMPWHGHQVSLHNNAGTTGTAYYYDGATKTDSTGAQASGITWKGTTFNAAQNGRGDQAGGADPVGGGQAHNHGSTEAESNMPPYLAVYMWKRTA